MSKNDETSAARPKPAPVAADAVDWAVPPENVRIWEDEFRRLNITAAGVTHENVRPRRVFPLSNKADYVTFLGDKEQELVMLANPDRLDEDSRKALEAALARVYYAARITRVDSITEAMGVSLWHVMTDRGYATFEIVDRQRHIRTLPGGRYLLSDVDGNRFEIDNINDLDPHSRTLVYTET